MNRAAAALLFALLVVGIAAAQSPEHVAIDSIIVTAGRHISETGVAMTRLDTFALRINPSKSLAEVVAGATPLYVKSYGRGTLATLSFRGTGPSHTQLLWNGMKITSPMLGSADYSLIPSYFVDDARLFHGAGSVSLSGGGFGGAVSLETAPRNIEGAELQFIQGVGSYLTFDEFLRVSYGTPRLQLSTRLHYVNSRNDFFFRNYDKEGYPVERNRNSHFRDMHLLQELYYKLNDKNQIEASVWFIDSRRNIPLISVNYRDEDKSVNRQYETTLRAVAGWKRNAERLKLEAKGGYTYSRLKYLRLEDDGSGQLNTITDARNKIHTGFGEIAADYYPLYNLMLSGGFSVYLHSVDSREAVTRDGYDKIRAETSLKLALRWRPWEGFTVGAEVREESYGRNFTPPIYTGFAEYLIWQVADMRLRVSGGRNYRYPTINDLYYQPGGNPSLKPESGYSYEAGMEAGFKRERFTFHAAITAYDSYIDNWILWMYSGNKGGAVWSPVNIRKVHSYGVELNGKIFADMGRRWRLRIDGGWGWTPSKNMSEPLGENDRSVGKQLPYTPLFSTSVAGRLGWRSWAFVWRFNHYSERFTTTSNAQNYLLNELGPYYMNDISLEKEFSPRWGEISVQFCVNNLFNEEYVSVLSRPMPGINFGIFLEITPKW